MKTEDLIKTLSLDETPPDRPRWLNAAAVAAACAVAAAILVLGYGVRGDIPEAMHDWRFLAKFAATGLLAVLAYRAARVSVDPVRRAKPAFQAFMAVIALVAAFVVAELLSVSSQQWLPRALGQNGALCLVLVPLLAAAPLAAILWVMRDGAPQSPTASGAAAGALAGGLAAFLYASHCTDDSPLFVAIWYSTAVLGVTGIGALLGRRVLAW